MVVQQRSTRPSVHCEVIGRSSDAHKTAASSPQHMPRVRLHCPPSVHVHLERESENCPKPEPPRQTPSPLSSGSPALAALGRRLLGAGLLHEHLLEDLLLLHDEGAHDPARREQPDNRRVSLECEACGATVPHAGSLVPSLWETPCLTRSARSNQRMS